EGLLDGVRIDHPDGLRRPAEYFARLRAAAPDAWIVAEKILEPGESLPRSWPIDGTTGYDFLTALGALFVDPQGAEPLDDLYGEVTGEPTDYGAVVYEAKRQILRCLLASDLNRLTQRFVEVCEGRRRYRDFTRHQLRETLAEVMASLDVYRTYVGEDGSSEAGERDRIETATAAARARRQDLDPELFALLQRILLGDRALNGTAEVELRARFQQLAGSVMAKGVEDAAFYRYLRMAALCEVGGDPDRFGYHDVAAFHERCERMHESWPATMLALSTHDTKRSEDIRARLYLLSEIPQTWAGAVRRWTDQNHRYRGGLSRPDPNIEYLLYQTLVGAHPLSLERALAYLEKAAKEARVHTSWVNPAPIYDRALRRFVERLYGRAEFMEDVARFVQPLVMPGWVTSLAQKLVQLTAPGVPDLYQGTELWDLSLVDPDNRRPVDYRLRRRLLDELPGLGSEEIWSRPAEGLPKLWVIQRALGLRAEHPPAFAPGPDGAYERLVIDGAAADHVVAFSRGARVATVVPRLVLGLASRGGWADTSVMLARGQWTNVLTGERLSGGETPMSELLARFPVALLAREEGP
ncbi:MAG: malto-oligosyltrehalose synthase, partial [Actinomycetota bacterium]